MNNKSRTLTTAIISIMLMYSCASVVFEQSIPKEHEMISSFPQHYRGTFVDENNDTLRILSTSFEYGNRDTSQTIMRKMLSAGDTELKEFKNYYILNIKDDSTYWTVLPMQLLDDELHVLDIDLAALRDSIHLDIPDVDKEQMLYERLQNITNTKPIRNDKGEIEYYLIDPSKAEFDQLLKEGLYNKTMIFKKVQ